MKFVVTLLFSTLVGGVFAQPFQPDAYGRVSGDVFKNFCDKRGYSLVGSFERLNGNEKQQAAMVIKSGTWLYIDLNGKEFPNYTTLAKEYGLRQPENFFWDDDMPFYNSQLDQVFPEGYKPKYTGTFQKGTKSGYKVQDKVIIPPIYDRVNQFSSGDFLYYLVENGDYKGLCDYKGTLITPLVYKYISFLPRGNSQCFFMVWDGSKKGILSRGGKVTVKPQFDDLRQETFGNDFVIFTYLNKRAGAISSAGKIAVKNQYDDLLVGVAENVLYGFLAKNEGKTGFLNKSGNVLIPIQYDKLGYDQKNFLTHRTETGVGAMDTTGKQLLPPIYKRVYKPVNGNCILVTTQETNLVGITDLSGNWLEEPSYVEANSLNYDQKELYVFNKSKEPFLEGLFNTTTLKWILNCEYNISQAGLHSLVEHQDVTNSPVAGILSNSGEFLIPMKYHDLRYVPEEKYAKASLGGKYGVIGHEDKIIVPFQYDALELLSLNYASRVPQLFVVASKQKMGVVHSAGKTVIPIKYDRILYTNSGFICQDSITYELLSFEGKKYLSSSRRFSYTTEGFFIWKDSSGWKAFDAYGRTGSYSPKPSYMSFQEFDMEPPIEVEAPLVAETKVNQIFETVDEEAQYPGGMTTLKKFVLDNLKYPETALELGVGGKCYLSFVVELDGSLTDIKVLRGVPDCKECDQEAIRLVKQMPKWIPGKIGGASVRSTYRLPILFNPG